MRNKESLITGLSYEYMAGFGRSLTHKKKGALEARRRKKSLVDSYAYRQLVLVVALLYCAVFATATTTAAAAAADRHNYKNK